MPTENKCGIETTPSSAVHNQLTRCDSYLAIRHAERSLAFVVALLQFELVVFVVARTSKSSSSSFHLIECNAI